MCILFIYYNPSCSNLDGYEVIVASNRDEFYERPTKPLSIWGPATSSVASGIDLQPGRQGGTWLGVCESGRLASLLNIYSDHAPNPNVKGRGFLVPNYLLSTATMTEYVKQIGSDTYEGYRLLLAERREHGWQIGTYSNKTGLMEEYGPGVHAFSNNLDSSLPFMKADYGRELFKSIITQHGAGTGQSDRLVDGLMQGLLADETRCLPRSAADRESFTLHKYPFYSSIKVVSSVGDYGTRTSSVLLVDGRGRCQFVERTRPGDGSSPWTTSSISLQLRCAR